MRYVQNDYNVEDEMDYISVQNTLNSRKGQQTNKKYWNLVGSDQ